jgi:hypothetical protein
MTRSFMILYPSDKYYRGDQINKKEMGGECGMYGRQERCIQGLGEET